jgi:hypothetical protein
LKDWVRVSCGGLCRIYDPERERYLLGLNQNQLKKQNRVLTPLGGVLHYFNDLPFTHRHEENTSSHDLRLFVPHADIDTFQAWFRSRQGREVDPFRELHEELVDEYQVLTHLDRTDVRAKHIRTVQSERFSNRTGATGVLTYSYQEIYDITFSAAESWERLRRVSPQTGLYWVTFEDIRRGNLTDQTVVNARSIIQQT